MGTNKSTKLTREEFLDLKRDYSPFLVHLTKKDIAGSSAKDVLTVIMKEKKLRAFNHNCLFKSRLKGNKFEEKFRVVCFTETPIDQISLLLHDVYGRQNKPEAYGIIFDKEFIRSKGGNPVFYAGDELTGILQSTFDQVEKNGFTCKEYKFLAIVNRCTKDNDFHWEREWRIVGDLDFQLNDIYLGLCPEEDIQYFETHYPPVKFICPTWGFSKTLRKLLPLSSS